MVFLSQRGSYCQSVYLCFEIRWLGRAQLGWLVDPPDASLFLRLKIPLLSQREPCCCSVWSVPILCKGEHKRELLQRVGSPYVVFKPQTHSGPCSLGTRGSAKIIFPKKKNSPEKRKINKLFASDVNYIFDSLG